MYIAPPNPCEMPYCVGLDMMGGIEAGINNIDLAQTSLQLPIKTEKMLDMLARQQATTELMVDVPYVKVGDIEVSVEWRVRNFDDEEGEFLLQLNGANEFFSYDPVAAAEGLDPDEPQPPGLDGDIPIHIGPKGSVTGIFREDQLVEASIDLEQMSRGNINPFRATLTVNKNAKQFSELSAQEYDADGEPLPQASTGVVYPRAAWAQIVRVDLVFKPDRHMRLEYDLRVRDKRGIVHDLADGAFTDPDAMGELQMFNPAVYTPPAPPP
jgi:hypothetical protein